jgi:maltose alpha-D-glucosyltransferase/alpha-amylase
VLRAPKNVLAVRFDWGGNASLFVHNFANRSAEVRVEFEPPEEAVKPLVCLQTDARSEPDARGVHRFRLDPYGYRWYRFGGLENLA